MGGLLNKKEKSVIGPNSKIGLESKCPICEKVLTKDTTFAEANKHKELCKQQLDKKNLEKLMKDLIKSKNELDKLELENNGINIESGSLIDSLDSGNFDKRNSAKNNTSNSNIKANNNSSSRSKVNKPKHSASVVNGVIKKNYNNDNIYNPSSNSYSNSTNGSNTNSSSNNSSAIKFANAINKIGKLAQIAEKAKPIKKINNSINNNSSSSKSTNNKKPAKKESRFDFLVSNFSTILTKELPFEEKHKRFKSNLQSLKVDWRESYCTLELDREHLLSQSISQFNKIDPYKELHINFKGEISHDAGGIIREWLTVIFKELQKDTHSKCLLEFILK